MLTVGSGLEWCPSEYDPIINSISGTLNASPNLDPGWIWSTLTELHLFIDGDMTILVQISLKFGLAITLVVSN